MTNSYARATGTSCSAVVYRGVILPAGSYSDWLDPRTDAREFMRQFPAERLRAMYVS